MKSLNFLGNTYVVPKFVSKSLFINERERFGSVTDRSFEISQQQQQQKSETKETEMANFS